MVKKIQLDSSICEDLIDAVFKRLPTKGAMKFRSLSKSRNKFVDLPYFRKHHFNHFLHDYNPVTQPLFIANSWIDDNIVIRMNLFPEKKIRNIVVTKDMLNGDWYSQEWIDDGYRITNSCNGLLLFKPNDYKQPLILCNPLSLEYWTIPFITENNLTCFSVGLGFSHRENKYKLVGVEVSSEPVMRIMVRDLGTSNGTWRCACICQLYPCRGPIYVYGNLYWICRSATTQQFQMIVFDVENENVKEIENVPALREGHHISKLKFMEFAGWITIAYVQDFTLKIYVLSDFYESHWKLEYCIKLPNVLKGMDVERVWDNDGKIHIFMGKMMLIYDDKEEKERMCMYAIVHQSNTTAWKLFTDYKPSFASLVDYDFDTKVGNSHLFESRESASCIWFTRPLHFLSCTLDGSICSSEKKDAEVNNFGSDKLIHMVRVVDDAAAINIWFTCVLAFIMNMFLLLY